MKIASFIILTLIPVALLENADSEDGERIKRSGFSLIGGAIQNLQKSAFGASASLSQGSANGVAGLSSSSSSSGHSSHGYDAHSNSYGHEDFDHHDDSKGFDGWSLKKSILNTLLQAVKAIAGGVTTLKGQLIKGSGYVVQQKGKLIASGGDSISNAGKNIIHSAHLVKPEDSHGHVSLGHSLGSGLGGLTKTISSLSAGSSSSLSGVSGSSSSSSSSSHGHDSGYASHGADYAAIDGHGIEYTNSFDNYDTKPVVHESYGPPKTTLISHIEQPHAIYGTPEYNDDTYRFAESQSSVVETADVLSEILKNIPHKPMKTVTHSFNQIPIPSNSPLPPPPPFKPLRNVPPFESAHTYSSSDKHTPYVVDPKAYDAYHSMTMKLSKPKAVLPTSLPGPISLGLLKDNDFEIQKSVQYEFKL